MNLEFWDFEEWVNKANIFPVFPDWSKGCLNIVCTQYTLESGLRCVQDFGVAGDFGPVFVEGSRMFQVKRRLRKSHSLFGGLQLSTKAKKYK